jgi:hypothetical protein
MVISKSDNYATPSHVWKDIEQYLPKDKIIYVPFYLDGGTLKSYLDLGCKKVIHEDVDFFTNTFIYDYVIDNPPFSKKKEILSKLKSDNTPFILLVPSGTIHTKYFRQMFKGDIDLQIIIPKSRINYISEESSVSNCPFDTIYLCWKMGLPRGLNWID